MQVKCRRCGGSGFRDIVERGEWHCIACGHRVPMITVRSQLQAATTPLMGADFPWSGQKVLAPKPLEPRLAEAHPLSARNAHSLMSRQPDRAVGVG